MPNISQIILPDSVLYDLKDKKAVRTIANQGLTATEKLNARNNIDAPYKLELTLAEYEQLSTAEKMNGTMYFITDGQEEEGIWVFWDQIIGKPSFGTAALKNIDTSIGTGSTSINLPTSQAVATFVEGKNYAPKATTIAGYGITDAKITSGTITLGSNSIKPVSVAANQGLTATEKLNARNNIEAVKCVELTLAEYNALPASKNSDGIQYFITNGDD